MNMVENLTFFVNNAQVSDIIMRSFVPQTNDGVIRSYRDASLYKERNPGGSPQLDVLLYADEADPSNAIGLLCDVLVSLFTFYTSNP